MFKLLKYLKGKSLKLTILSVIFTFLSAAFDILQPLLLTYVISIVQVINGTVTQDVPLFFNIVVNASNAWYYFWLLCSIMGIAAIFSFFLGVLSSYTASKSSLLWIQNIRSACYKQILSYSISELDKFSVTSLITRLTNDAQKIQTTYLLFATVLIKTPLLIIGGFILAFIFSWQMGLLIIGIISIMAVIVGILGTRATPLFNASQKSIDEASSVMRENILGARVVKSFNLQEDQTRRYNFFNEKLRFFAYRSQSWIIPIISVVQLFLNLGVVSILTLGGFLVMTQGDPNLANQIFGIVSTMVMILSSFVSAFISFSMFVRTKTSFKRINEVIETEPKIVSPINYKHFDENNYDIEFENVSFSYLENANNKVLKDLNFKIKTGSTFGIIGSTGSGKSSIINLIPRLHDVTSGSIKINNVNVKDLSIDELRKNIAVVLQEQILFSGDIKYNLRYGKSDATEEEMIEACKQACAWEFVSQLPSKLNSTVEQRGRNFSGGQKQRLCLARALIKKPKILILDDTTSALDLITETKIQENIKKNLTKCTKIIISERVSSVKDADQIIVLEDGFITGIGTNKQLIKTNSFYRNLVNSQLGSMKG